MTAFSPQGRVAPAALPSSGQCPHLKPGAWQEWTCGITGVSTDADCLSAGAEQCLPSRAFALFLGKDDLRDLTVLERDAVRRIAHGRYGVPMGRPRPTMSAAARERWEIGARQGGIMSAAARGFRGWSGEDILRLAAFRATGTKWRDLAKALGRSIGSCAQAYQRLVLHRPRRAQTRPPLSSP
jgi:hypothetical protein